MSDSFCTIAGHLVTDAQVEIPWQGAWYADVSTADGVDLSGKVEIVLGGMKMQGTVFRGGQFAGASRFRVVGGADGWRKILPARCYEHAVGVKAATIIGDAAKSVGETLASQPPGTAGPHFVREVGPASRLFGALGLSWWIGIDGRTNFGERPTTTLATGFRVLDVDPANGKATLAAEEPGPIQPGVILASVGSSAYSIVSVSHVLTKGSFRTEVWSK